MKDDIRVILADNNVQDRESKKRLLNEQGIQVVYETGDGKKALENIKKLKPDVVVMDMILPGVDGLEILEECREFTEYKPLFIIATALRTRGIDRTGISTGSKLLYDETVISNDVDQTDQTDRSQCRRRGRGTSCST